MPLRDRIFDSQWEQWFLRSYRKLFSIAEIESSATAKWVFGASLLFTLITFFAWMQATAISIQAYASNAYTCWPYFQNCGQYYFLQALPFGYSQNIFYIGLFTILVLCAYLASKDEWVLAHMGLVVLWTWKVIAALVLSPVLSGNYIYYDLILSFVLLFLPYKDFFLRLTFVVLYFLASTIKFDQGWILGTYFTSLASGIPLFGNSLAPIVTNIVIAIQVVGAWVLLGEQMLFRTVIFWILLSFHLYSGILIRYRFPIESASLLIILFGPLYHRMRPPLTRASIPGWLFIACLFLLQLTPIIAIPGDQKITLEGNALGIYVFEANHQCRNQITVHYANGTAKNLSSESMYAHDRCNPYRVWFWITQTCLRDPNIARVTWTFDHSINGEPFYRMIDTQNACALTYSPLAHNPWIKTPSEGASIVGYPVTNFYTAEGPAQE